MSWEMMKLGDLIDVLSGFAFDSKCFNESIGMPLIRIRDIKRSYSDTFYNGEFDERFIINRGDILIGMDGEFNIAEWKGSRALLNQRVCKVSVSDDNRLLIRYLLYFLPFQLKIIEDKASFVTVKHLSVNDIKNIQIPLPPLPTQKRIAEILDAADALKRKDQALLKKYDELAQAIFIDMFGDPVKNEKGWDCLIGKEYANKISVGVVIKPASYYVNEGIPALRSQNVRPNRITKDNLVYFSEETNEKVLHKSKIFTGDVLIVRTGQPGTAAVVEADVNGVNCIDMLIVSPKKEIVSPYYLAFFLNSDAGKNYIASNQKGQIQQHFNVGDINKFKIPIPPISLQSKFELILLNLKSQLSKDIICNSESLFQTLLQKAFKGELY